MRLTFASLLLVISATLAALAVSTFWLQRIAFTPANAADNASAVMSDADLRNEVTSVIADRTAGAMQMTPQALRDRLAEYAQLGGGPETYAGTIEGAHATLIGQADNVEVDGGQLTEIVRDQLVNDLDPIVLPVEKITVLDWIDTGLDWIPLVSAILALIVFVVALLARPERSDFTLGLASLCAMSAVLFVVIDWIVPRFALPALGNDTWLHVFAAQGASAQTRVLTAAVVCLGLAGASAIASGRNQRRRQWSTPLAVSRYREQRHWS